MSILLLSIHLDHSFYVQLVAGLIPLKLLELLSFINVIITVMSSTFTIAIAGISSRLARYVTQELLKHPNVHLRGSCRDIGKLPSDLTHSPRLLLMQAEPYDIDKLRSLVHGCDVVICCYCADDKTMLDGQKLLIDLCEVEGVSRYIASDYTADFTKLDWGDIVVKEPMKHIKAYLDSKAKVNGVHILVGLLMEAFLAYFNVWDSKANKLYYWGTGSEKWDLTTYQTAAEFVAAVALDHNAVGLLKCNVSLSYEQDSRLLTEYSPGRSKERLRNGR